MRPILYTCDSGKTLIERGIEAYAWEVGKAQIGDFILLPLEYRVTPQGFVVSKAEFVGELKQFI